MVTQSHHVYFHYYGSLIAQCKVDCLPEKLAGWTSSFGLSATFWKNSSSITSLYILSSTEKLTYNFQQVQCFLPSVTSCNLLLVYEQVCSIRCGVSLHTEWLFSYSYWQNYQIFSIISFFTFLANLKLFWIGT